jgi:hypothetical protein
MRSRLKLSALLRVKKLGTLPSRRTSMPPCGVAYVKTLSTAFRFASAPSFGFCRNARQISPPIECATR